MNSKTVLSKILTLLSFDETVKLTYAKLKDGTIVESKTFDVGEELFVISEDGNKTPAPDGEHELALSDSEEKRELIKVITKDGKIVERENVELETVEVKDIPQASGDSEKANEVKDQEGQVASGTMKMEEETEEVETLPEDAEKEDMKKEVEIKLEDMVKKIEEMAYRIDEMEKKMLGKEEEEKMKEDKKEDMELPKLDGAPVDTKMSAIESNTKNYGKKVKDSQSSFLSKLYN